MRFPVVRVSWEQVRFCRNPKNRVLDLVLDDCHNIYGDDRIC